MLGKHLIGRDAQLLAVEKIEDNNLLLKLLLKGESFYDVQDNIIDKISDKAILVKIILDDKLYSKNKIRALNKLNDWDEYERLAFGPLQKDGPYYGFLKHSIADKFFQKGISPETENEAAISFLSKAAELDPDLKFQADSMILIKSQESMKTIKFIKKYRRDVDVDDGYNQYIKGKEREYEIYTAPSIEIGMEFLKHREIQSSLSVDYFVVVETPKARIIKDKLNTHREDKV